MNDLKVIKAQVYKQRPVLLEIENKFGHLKLHEYVRTAWELPVEKPDKVFLDVLTLFSNNLFGQEIGEQITAQLKQKPLISTVDHLGIWGHPIFVNADLIYSLYFQPSELVICLGTESVSLNNVTSWSASILKTADDGRVERYSFFPDKLKTLPVFSAPAITQTDIARFSKSFGGAAKDFVDILYLLSSTLNFSTQACLASFNLWKKVFPSAPKLVYLPLESIVLEYIKSISSEEQNIIFKLIFSQQGQDLWQKYFSNEHTFMFWGIDQKGRREKLVSLPGKDEILNLIEKRKIYPSSPLCFMVLLLSGFACAGGFTQTTWLSLVKEDFINLLKDLNAPADVIKKVAIIPTKNFAESCLAKIKIGQRHIEPSGLDLLLTGKDYYPEFLEQAKKITLTESLDKAMPGIYKVVVGKRN